MSHTVKIDRAGKLDEDTARRWLRSNATGNRRWSIPAWRVMVRTKFDAMGRVTVEGPTTAAIVNFENETDATLFAIWAGGRIEA